MSVFSRFFHSRDKPEELRRAQDTLGGSRFSFFFGGSTSGKPVNERTALQMTAVYSCVRILSEAVAGLPLHVYRYGENGSKVKALDHPLYRLLHDEPNPEMTSFNFRETLMGHLLLYGNAYAQIIRNGKGEVIGLYPLMPTKMTVDRDSKGQVYYLYTRGSDDSPVDDENGQVYLPPEQVLHIPGLGYDGIVGYSPIAMAKNAVGMAIACEEYEKLGFARPVVLDANGAWEAVLENAFDIVVTSEVNGADTMEFYLPFHDPKRAMLDNEKQVQIVNDIYRIRTLTDTKDTDGRIITQVYAEAAFYDLSFSEEKETVDFNADTADAPMRHALEGTGWSVGTVNVTTLRTWQCTEKNALSILRATQNIHGGDLIFDCPNRLVHLLTFGGNDSGALFAYRKNLKSIERVVDTRSLVTRLYAYGKDGMKFASINNGKEYVEDFTYTSEVRISTLDCSNFTNPYQMLEYTQMRLAQYAQPRVSYVLSAMDLSALTGYEHEAWALGDIVTVDDKDLNLSVKTRVVRRQYNLQEPWKTVLELSTTLRELGDSSAQWDKAADVLASTDVIDRQEVKDLVPFNHLRNSRADSGMNYWTNSGFEVDAENGVSGTASFKAEGVLGMTKSLTQTVYPASRRSYTFSAQIASEDLQKGPSGQVGIEVTFEYEDGSTETRFIDLF